MKKVLIVAAVVVVAAVAFAARRAHTLNATALAVRALCLEHGIVGARYVADANSCILMFDDGTATVVVIQED